MTRLDPAQGRQRERIVGSIVVLVGVAVLVLSIVALVGAATGAGSDVAGPAVTLPGGSGSAPATTSGSPAPSSTPSGSATAASSTAPSGTASAPSSGSGAVGSLPLVVLNNTRTSGLAQQAAATFTAGGWTVTGTANLDEDILSTCAYYDPDVEGAQAAAEALMEQFPAIKRTKEKFGALPDGPVVVVLTADYTAQ